MGTGTGTALAERKYERTVAGLRGRRIMQVAYYPLTECTGGCADEAPGQTVDQPADEHGASWALCCQGECEVEEWDFGGWHLPTMGVVFTFDDGVSALATWNTTFEHFGLEVTVAPSRASLRDISPPGTPSEVLVGDHKRWAAFVGEPLTDAGICWSSPARDGAARLPLAVRLEVAGGERVWIAAGVPATWPFNGRFHLGTDDVLVIFDSELAQREPELRPR